MGELGKMGENGGQWEKWREKKEKYGRGGGFVEMGKYDGECRNRLRGGKEMFGNMKGNGVKWVPIFHP